MLLWRPPRGGKVSRKQMQARCDAFNTGAWRSLIDDSMRVAHQASAAIDTTMVSPLHRDERATRGAASTPGVALRRTRRRKEQTYPELHGAGGRARLVVLAAEVGGRWSNEAAQFLGELAAFKASTAPEILREPCSAAKAFVLSLLDKRPVTGAGSCPPSGPRGCEGMQARVV